MSKHFTAVTNDIWVCSIDGSNRVKISTNTNDNFEPAWSPNSQKVIYTELLPGDKACINVVSADGSNQVCLTDSTALDYSPVYSPDGSKIVYIKRTGPVGTSELYIMNANGSGKLQLTNTGGAGNVYDPSWSPGL